MLIYLLMYIKQIAIFLDMLAYHTLCDQIASYLLS